MKRTVLTVIFAVAAVALPLLAGCNCESESVEELDAGLDAGPLLDAGSDAAWVPEIPGEDAAAEQREVADCEGKCCALPEEVALLASDVQEVRPVSALAVDRAANLFASVERDLGACLDQLAVFELESSSYQPEVWTLMDDCELIDTAIIGPGDGGWLLLWVDHRDSTEVRATVYPPGQDPVSADPFQLSESDRMERELAMASVGDSVLVAWAEEDLSTGTWAVATRQIAATGEPLGPVTIVREVNEGSIKSLDLTAFAEDSAFLIYKAGGDQPQLVLQKLDATGQVLEPFEVLSDAVGRHGSGAATSDSEGGAVVYAIAPDPTGGEIHFRTINAAGDLEQNDRRIVSAPEQGADPSIIKLPTGVGYMVAYRAVRNRGSETTGMIRVMSLDRDGNVQGSSDVYHASLSGNRTSLAVTSDQRVALSWSDVYDDGTREHMMVNLWCME